MTAFPVGIKNHIMVKPTLKYTVVAVCYWIVVLATFSSAIPAIAERASIVIDADSSVVLHAKNARLQSYPASLAKLMTAYLVFEAMASNQLSLSDQLQVSVSAARMPAVRLGLRQGQTVTLQEVLLAVIVQSANDAAVVLAEAMAGSEPAFAVRMNAKAKTLGMSDTVFQNASGLPHPGQITSARDMAILAQALMTDYPQFIEFVRARAFQYRGKTLNTRPDFTNSFDGIQGLKTGFTCFAGYNLVAMVDKDGRRLIGVILGERNPRQRNARMSKLIKKAFHADHSQEKILTIHHISIKANPSSGLAPNKKAIAEVCAVGSQGPEFSRASGWGLLIGVKKEPKEALTLSRQAMKQYPRLLKDGQPVAIPFLQGVLLNRACITGLKKESAIATCRQLRKKGAYCVVLNPKLVRLYVEKAYAALEIAQAAVDISQTGRPASIP